MLISWTRMADLLSQLKALADPSRMRIVRALAVGPLHVNEILDILGMGQSRVSRHLRILSDAGILRSSRDGSRIYYAIHPDFQSSALWPLFASGDDTPPVDYRLQQDLIQDRERLQGLLESRKRQSLVHFQDFGARQDEDQRAYVDGDYYRRRILELLPAKPGVLLEPGCGAGLLSASLASRAKHLILVDQSQAMLDLARQRIGESPGVEYRIGYLEHLPLADEEADTVVLSMVLHHIPEPAQALREIFRTLRPGGTLVVAELDHHEEENMRRMFDDFWLGFTPKRLSQDAGMAGFEGIALDQGRSSGRLNCLFLTARRPLTGKPPKETRGRKRLESVLSTR